MATNATRPAREARRITQDDLRWLACPVCKDSLVLKQTSGAGLHRIICNGCKREYPVVDGLPVLLADRAAV